MEKSKKMKRRSFMGAGLVGSGLTVATSVTLGKPATPFSSGSSFLNAELPKFETGSRLLFQGDSITDMKWGRNQKDRNHYLGHSYVFLIAARLGVELPNSKLEFLNRGVSGNKVGDLRKRWQKDAIEMKPDWLSILIGVNDISRGEKSGVHLEKWEEDYRFILEHSRKENPKLKIVLMDPFVLRMTRLSSDDAWKYWRGEIDKLGEVVKRISTEFKAVHIETQKIFDQAAQQVSPQHWIWDGVHPLPQGHELIARNWLQAVGGASNKKG
jgi:lysophospholipase L1-like esterase